MEGDIEDGEILDEENVVDDDVKNKKLTIITKSSTAVNEQLQRDHDDEDELTSKLSKTSSDISSKHKSSFEQNTINHNNNNNNSININNNNNNNNNSVSKIVAINENDGNKRRKSNDLLAVEGLSDNSSISSLINGRRKKFRRQSVEADVIDEDMICISGGSLQLSPPLARQRQLLSPDDVDSSSSSGQQLHHQDHHHYHHNRVRKEPLLPDPQIPPNDDIKAKSICSGGKYGGAGKISNNNNNNNTNRNSKDDGDLCIFFLQGRCNRGSECSFIHALNKPRRLEPCKFYLMDRCNKRDQCGYMHNDFPCKFYHAGLKCFLGKECKFSHRKLDDLHRKILVRYLRKIDQTSAVTAIETMNISNNGSSNNNNNTNYRKVRRSSLCSDVGGSEEDIEYYHNKSSQHYQRSNNSNNNNSSNTINNDNKIPSLFDIKVSLPPEVALFVNDDNVNGASNKEKFLHDDDNDRNKNKKNINNINNRSTLNYRTLIDERPFSVSSMSVGIAAGTATTTDTYNKFNKQTMKYDIESEIVRGYSSSNNNDRSCVSKLSTDKEEFYRKIESTKYDNEYHCYNSQQQQRRPDTKEYDSSPITDEPPRIKKKRYHDYRGEQSAADVIVSTDENLASNRNDDRHRRHHHRHHRDKDDNSRPGNRSKSAADNDNLIIDDDDNCKNNGRSELGTATTPLCSPNSTGFSGDDCWEITSKEYDNIEKDQIRPAKSSNNNNNKKKNKKKRRSNSEEKKYLEKEIRKLTRKEKRSKKIKRKNHHYHHRNQMQNYDFPEPYKDESEMRSSPRQTSSTTTPVRYYDDDGRENVIAEAPSHLPRKQRELYRRIQQHQKEIDDDNDETATTIDMNNSTTTSSNNNNNNNNNNHNRVHRSSNSEVVVDWYSSDEEGVSSLDTIMRSIKTTVSSSASSSAIRNKDDNNYKSGGSNRFIDSTATALNISQLTDIHISDEVSKILSTIRDQSTTTTAISDSDRRTVESSSVAVCDRTSINSKSDVNSILSNLGLSTFNEHSNNSNNNNNNSSSNNNNNNNDNKVVQSGQDDDDDDDDDDVENDGNDASGFPFKPVPNHETANEIDASLLSHLPMDYKLIPLDPIPKVNYASMPSVCNTSPLDPRFKNNNSNNNNKPSSSSGKIDPRLEIVNINKLPNNNNNNNNNTTTNTSSSNSNNLINTNSFYHTPPPNLIGNVITTLNGTNSMPVIVEAPPSSSSSLTPSTYTTPPPPIDVSSSVVKKDVSSELRINEKRDPRLTSRSMIATPVVHQNDTTPTDPRLGSMPPTDPRLAILNANTLPPPTVVISVPPPLLNTSVPPPSLLNVPTNFNVGPLQNESHRHIPRPTDPRIRFNNNNFTPVVNVSGVQSSSSGNTL